MKVKELIEYLEKCEPAFDVMIDECGIGGVVEHKDITQPEASYVNLWSC